MHSSKFMTHFLLLSSLVGYAWAKTVTYDWHIGWTLVRCLDTTHRSSLTRKRQRLMVFLDPSSVSMGSGRKSGTLLDTVADLLPAHLRLKRMSAIPLLLTPIMNWGTRQPRFISMECTRTEQLHQMVLPVSLSVVWHLASIFSTALWQIRRVHIGGIATLKRNIRTD